MDIEQLAAQISLSISQYKRILDLFTKMDVEIGTASPAYLKDMGNSLAELQRQANDIDQSFLDQLTKNLATNERIHSLLDNRATVVNDILLFNRKIATKAANVQSLLAHEIAALRNGLSALKGYKQQEQGQGRIVNNTS